MAEFIKALFGGSQPSATPLSARDADFADFADAPDPSPVAFTASSVDSSFGSTARQTIAPYTKWYNVHERYSLTDFKQEGYILLIVALFIALHLWGTRVNRAKAKAWTKAHASVLWKEFALVGFENYDAATRTNAVAQTAESPAEFGNEHPRAPEELMKEKSLNSFSTYATGRQNVAFLDVNLTLFKRYNPLTLAGEFITGFFFESMPAPTEKMDAILYTFDGKETLTVPSLSATQAKDMKSTYDGFVWAIVNKDCMKQLRDERYDVSITTTKDSPKLPSWVTVMSESAEVTEMLLTPELVSIIDQVGEIINYLIITDQPTDKPVTLDDTIPKKRVYLSTRLSSAADAALPIFEYFLRIPDVLAQSAHFRPEVMRKIRTTREDQVRRLRKVDEDEKAEERALEREKAKKMKRDLELKGLDAKAQKKYLEKEKEREQKKAMKKQATRG